MAQSYPLLSRLEPFYGTYIIVKFPYFDDCGGCVVGVAAGGGETVLLGVCVVVGFIIAPLTSPVCVFDVFPFK